MIKFTVGKINDVPNKINKTFNELYSFNILLKDDTDLKNPTIVVNEGQPNLLLQSNYASLNIGGSNRYYFINDITILENGNYEIRMHTDVLYTYAPFIKKYISMLADRADIESMNKLIAGDFPTNVNDKMIQYKVDNPIFTREKIYAILAVSGGYLGGSPGDELTTGLEN